MSTRCSLVMCLYFGEEGIEFLLESGMTSLKGHGHSAGQQVPASPHCAWPPQGQAVQSHHSSPSCCPGSWDEGIQPRYVPLCWLLAQDA